MKVIGQWRLSTLLLVTAVASTLLYLNIAPTYVEGVSAKYSYISYGWPMGFCSSWPSGSVYLSLPPIVVDCLVGIFFVFGAGISWEIRARKRIAAAKTGDVYGQASGGDQKDA